jgi:hypothetical protein
MAGCCPASSEIGLSDRPDVRIRSRYASSYFDAAVYLQSEFAYRISD